ncbi:MAG TPA: L,D-transpeptidase family protein [Phnomibacter sp.]|nr:L,D-transpeptidase family protein [Phnomibacter sp.]
MKKNDPWHVIEVPAKKWGVADSVPAISKIKQRLHLLGDYTLTDTTAIYTDSVAVALKRYQQRMGLASTGAPGTETMAVLNTPLKHLIQQILINMERARWVPKPGLGRYIVVNIPSFTLYVFDSGHQVWRTNVVVGKPASNTVIFNGDLKFVVLAPYWNVPYSIVKNEMGRTASYFAKRNMEVVGRYADGIPMVRQKPGPSNSLGKVKFLFPNSYNIYLHDTPAKDLFGQTKRAFSHGCIRVQNPAWLAEYLLKEMPEWTPQKIKETMDGKKEVSITLPKTIPVFIGYFTAWVDEAGALQLRPDIYKHDAKMATRLFEKPQ